MKLELLTIGVAINPTHSGDARVMVTDACNEHFRALRDETVIVDWAYDPEGTDGHATIEVAEPYVEDSFLDGLTRRPAAPLATMLDLSTAHMPAAEREAFTGSVRHVEHEHGWIVFVYGDLEPEETAELVPEWLLPIWQVALAADCILINFDADGDVHDGFPVYP